MDINDSTDDVVGVMVFHDNKSSETYIIQSKISVLRRMLFIASFKRGYFLRFLKDAIIPWRDVNTKSNITYIDLLLLGTESFDKLMRFYFDKFVIRRSTLIVSDSKDQCKLDGNAVTINFINHLVELNRYSMVDILNYLRRDKFTIGVPFMLSTGLCNHMEVRGTVSDVIELIADHHTIVSYFFGNKYNDGMLYEIYAENIIRYTLVPILDTDRRDFFESCSAFIACTLNKFGVPDVVATDSLTVHPPNTESNSLTIWPIGTESKYLVDLSDYDIIGTDNSINEETIDSINRAVYMIKDCVKHYFKTKRTKFRNYWIR